MKLSFMLIAVFGAIAIAGIAALLTPEVTTDVLLRGPVLLGIPLHTFFEIAAVGLFVWIARKLRKGVFFRVSLAMAAASFVSVLITMFLPSFTWLVPMIYAELNLLALGVLAASIHGLGKK